MKTLEFVLHGYKPTRRHEREEYTCDELKNESVLQYHYIRSMLILHQGQVPKFFESDDMTNWSISRTTSNYRDKTFRVTINMTTTLILSVLNF